MKRETLQNKLKSIKAGSHLCFFYETEEEHRTFIVPFVRQGLEKGEKVLYIADDHDPENILENLSDDGRDFEIYIRKGQFIILTAQETYQKEKNFDPDRMIAFLKTETKKAISEGFSALRITGEMSWVLRNLSASDKLIEYESKLNNFFPDSKCLAACQYDVRKFDHDFLFNVLITHPVVAVGNEIYENFYYIQPDEFFNRDAPSQKLGRWIHLLGERKRLQDSLKKEGEALRESEGLYRSVFEIAANVIASVDKDGMVVDCNQRVEQVLGYTRDEVVGQPVEKFIHPDYFPKALEDLREVINKGYSYNKQYKMMRKDGLLIDVSANSSALRNAKGEFIRTISILEDITERKQAQEALYESEKRYRQLIEVSPEVILILNNNMIIFANSAAFRLLNVTHPKEIIGRYISDFVAPEGKQAIQDYFQKIPEGGKDDPIEAKMILPDGQTVDVEWIGTPLAQTEMTSTLALGRDITARKRAETLLISSEERYRTVIEHSNDGVAIIKNNKYLYVNRKFMEIFGYKRTDEIIGKKNIITVHPDDQKRVVEISRMRQKGEDAPSRYEFKGIRKNSEVVFIEVSVTPITYGEDAALLVYFRDVTEYRRAEQAFKESEEKYRSMMENASDAILIADFDGNILETNKRASEVFRYSRDEFLDINIKQLHPDDELDRVLGAFEEIKATGLGSLSNGMIVRKDGKMLPIDIKGSVIEFRGKKVVQGIFRDIAGYKQAEKALRESEELLRILLQNTDDVIIMQDLEGRYLYFNGSSRYGIKAEDVIGKIPSDFFDAATTRRIMDHIREAAQEKKATTSEEKIVFKEEALWFHVEASPVFDTSGNAVAITMFARNITERKNNEEALQYRASFENLITTISTNFISIGLDKVDAEIDRALKAIGEFVNVDRSYIFLLREDGVTLDNTHEWCAKGIDSYIMDLKGIPASTFPWLMDRMKRFETIHVDRVAALPAEAKAEKTEFQREGIRSIVIVPMIFGQTLIGFLGLDSVKKAKTWTEDAVTLLRVVGEIFAGAIERKRAEVKLNVEVKKFQSFVDHVPFGVAFIESGTRTTYINAKFTQISGYDLDDVADQGQWFESAYPDREYRDYVYSQWTDDFQHIQEKGEISRQFKVTCKDGTLKIMDIHAVPIGNEKTLMVFDDITEKKRMEEELFKAKNIESIGVLAGGIAHDFNNLLTAVLGNISLARMYLPTKDKVFTRLVEAEKICLATKELTQQLLIFSKGGESLKKLLNVNNIIKDTTRIALSGSNVKPRYELADNLYAVEGDEGQIQRVIHNLVTNAREAMPAGGLITIRTENVTNGLPGELPLAAGDYAKISVEDTGAGIPEESRRQIFDPYFTTKEMGSQRGTGLGLAIVYSIVKKHGGYITVDFTPDIGSTFHVYLPAMTKDSTSLQRSDDGLLHGEGSILLMDDEDTVRDVTCMILQHLGYSVTPAQNGNEAIRFYQEALDSGKSFDIVILDLTIPGGMGGKEAMKKLTAIDSNVRAIVSTGYADDPIISEFRKYGFKNAIAKPFRIEELGEILYTIKNKT